MDPYETPAPQPAQQRAVSTTSMEAKDCDPAPLHFSGSSRSPADRLLEDDAAFRSSIASLAPLAQLQHCLSALGGPGTSLTDPDNEVALDLLITILDAAMQGESNLCLQYVPASCYLTLSHRYAAQYSSYDRSLRRQNYSFAGATCVRWELMISLRRAAVQARIRIHSWQTPPCYDIPWAVATAGRVAVQGPGPAGEASGFAIRQGQPRRGSGKGYGLYLRGPSLSAGTTAGRTAPQGAPAGPDAPRAATGVE